MATGIGVEIVGFESAVGIRMNAMRVPLNCFHTQGLLFDTMLPLSVLQT